VKIKKIVCASSVKLAIEISILRGSGDPPMGVTTLAFRRLVEVIKDYVRLKGQGHRSRGSGENRGQSFDFDLEYLWNRAKVKVKVKRKL
jgi:hypothetical protein